MQDQKQNKNSGNQKIKEKLNKGIKEISEIKLKNGEIGLKNKKETNRKKDKKRKCTNKK